MDQFLAPETDTKRQFLEPETDVKCQFLLLGPETDILCQFLEPETDIMGERNYIRVVTLYPGPRPNNSTQLELLHCTLARFLPIPHN